MSCNVSLDAVPMFFCTVIHHLIQTIPSSLPTPLPSAKKPNMSFVTYDIWLFGLMMLAKVLGSSIAVLDW